MQVILLEKIDNLGGLGDLVDVKPGFARNFLVPQYKAKSATPANIAEINERRAELEKAAADALAVANERADSLADQTVEIASRAGSEGKLFGSIDTDMIATAISAQLHIDVERKEIRLSEGPLRNVGTYEIDLHLHADVDTTITVVVLTEDE